MRSGVRPSEPPNPKRFLSDAAYQKNLANQLAMTPQTLAELARVGMARDAVLPLEYFFYTNKRERAEELAEALRGLGYSAEARPAAPAEDSEDSFLTTGWTTPMPMDEVTVLGWTRNMAQLGFQYDCDFDGWGAHPK